MTNTNTHMAVAARRGLDSTSSLILHEVYLAYPNEVTFRAIGKKLNIVEKLFNPQLEELIITVCQLNIKLIKTNKISPCKH